MMEVEVWEPWESSGGVQNLFRTFKGDLLEEGAFEMDLKIGIGVCQLKKDICRHAFNTHSFNRHFSRPPRNQALGRPMLGTRSNSWSHLEELPIWWGDSQARECSSPGRLKWDRGERRVVGAQRRVARDFPHKGALMLSPEE